MIHMYDGPVSGFAVRAVIHYSIVSTKTIIFGNDEPQGPYHQTREELK